MNIQVPSRPTMMPRSPLYLAALLSPLIRTCSWKNINQKYTHIHTHTHTHTHTHCILPRCSALWCAPVHGTYLRHGTRGTYLYQIWDIELGGHVWGMELEGQIWTRRNRRTNLRYGIKRTYLGHAFASTYLDTELGGQIWGMGWRGHIWDIELGGTYLGHGIKRIFGT